ncbi:MAG: homoserine O-succinyltransferase [Coriobacteriales bacterium]
MPIKIPDGLPAVQTLRRENIFVMDEVRAATQEIRPLEVLLLNLMPTKIATETQFARLLGNTPLQVELTLLKTATHKATHASEGHMLAFYQTFDQIRDRKFDGMVITGAPVELLDFEDVEYWQELCEIFDWTRSNVYSTLHICWGAQAALYHRYGVPKHRLPHKLFGVYPHTLDYRRSILFRGFDDMFMVPQSRYTTTLRDDIQCVPELQVLSSSDEAGVFAVKTAGGRQIFITGHAEYDAKTLDAEYRRDLAAGKPIDVPKNYYPDDDPSKPPRVTWRSTANLLFINWLNYFVYQSTPFELADIGTERAGSWSDDVDEDDLAG